MLFFFFKQKTAYEMRISDWSSDVCSSDLRAAQKRRTARDIGRGGAVQITEDEHAIALIDATQRRTGRHQHRIRVGIERHLERSDRQIGRASCRERVCQYV